VQGVIVINADGIPIRTTLDHKTSVQVRTLIGFASCLDGAARTQYAALVSMLTSKARAVLKELPLPGATVDSAAVRFPGWRTGNALT
jgi:hypothetical protein